MARQKGCCVGHLWTPCQHLSTIPRDNDHLWRPSSPGQTGTVLEIGAWNPAELLKYGLTGFKHLQTNADIWYIYIYYRYSYKEFRTGLPTRALGKHLIDFFLIARVVDSTCYCSPCSSAQGYCRIVETWKECLLNMSNAFPCVQSHLVDSISPALQAISKHWQFSIFVLKTCWIIAKNVTSFLDVPSTSVSATTSRLLLRKFVGMVWYCQFHWLKWRKRVAPKQLWNGRPAWSQWWHP